MGKKGTWDRTLHFYFCLATSWKAKHGWKWGHPGWLNSDKDIDNWWNRERDFERWWEKKTITT